MKRVLLPTDFSKNSLKAIFYALKLYGEKEKYTLLHTFDIPYSDHSVPEAMGKSLEERIENQFFSVIRQINEKFPNNDFDIETEFLTGNLTKTVAKYVTEERIKIIVMGSKGANDWAGKFIGTQTYSIIKNVDCSVIAIPAHNNKFEPKKIVLAVEPATKFKNYNLGELRLIAEKYRSEIKILSICTAKKEQVNEGYFKDELGSLPHKFIYIEGGDVQENIEDFVDNENAGLLCILIRETNFIDSIFKKSVAKKLIIQNKIPMMCINEDPAI